MFSREVGSCESMFIFGTLSTLSSVTEGQIEPVGGYAMAEGQSHSRKLQNIDVGKRQSRDHCCVCEPSSYKQRLHHP